MPKKYDFISLPDDDRKLAAHLASQVGGTLAEHLQCWNIIGVKLENTRKDNPGDYAETIMFSEGIEAPGNQEMIDDAILLMADQILRRRAGG